MEVDVQTGRIGASFRKVDKAAQRPFGSLVKALRTEQNRQQGVVADRIREFSQATFDCYRLWGDREVRRLEAGRMSLTAALVRAVAMALETDCMDCGMLYEVAGMNGVAYTVVELLKHPEHAVSREVYALLQREAQRTADTLAAFIASPLPNAPEHAYAHPLWTDPLLLPAAREIFRNLVTSSMLVAVDAIWAQQRADA